jgi:hypothetical protein
MAEKERQYPHRTRIFLMPLLVLPVSMNFFVQKSGQHFGLINH